MCSVTGNNRQPGGLRSKRVSEALVRGRFLPASIPGGPGPGGAGFSELSMELTITQGIQRINKGMS